MAYINGKEILFSAEVRGSEIIIGSIIDGSITKMTEADFKGVGAIKHGAFADCYWLRNIEIPETVKTIGRRAFRSCALLTSINIPENVTKIEDETFYGCGITSIILPRGLTSIGVSAFFYANFPEITIPALVTSIGNTAFAHSSKLKTVTVLADEPPTLGSSVFYNCTALEKIIVPSGCGAAYKSATNWAAHADIIEEVTE
jgi:hypothetical protein